MKIVNWNVQRPQITSRKNPLRVEHLLSIQPDIAILTETNSAVDLGPDYTGFLTIHTARKPGEGEAVASIWIKKQTVALVQVIETSDPSEAICTELCLFGSRMIVYSSIIPYHAWRGFDRKSKMWQEHKNAIIWHRKDWLMLRERFPEHALIAAGDYNQHRDGVGRYGTLEVRQLLSEALRDSRLVCITEADFVASVGLSRRNVDHVCISAEILSSVQVVHAWEGTVLGKKLSDHNGITVILDETIIRKQSTEIQHLD